METIDFKLKVVFLSPVLGSQPTDPEIASQHIAKKKGLDYPGGQDDELLPEALEKGTTVFYRTRNGNPCLMNYQVLGFLKESARWQNGKVAGGVKNLRSKVSALVFLAHRHIELHLPEGGEMDYLERPLRAMTAMGERITLARSEMLPAGTWFETDIQVLQGAEINEAVLRDLLDYGYFRGMMQWRGSGAFGTFRYELIAE